MARIVPSLQLAKTYILHLHLHLHFRPRIEIFSAYSILRAALFSAASPAERLRSAGSLAIMTSLETGPSVYRLAFEAAYASKFDIKLIQVAHRFKGSLPGYSGS